MDPYSGGRKLEGKMVGISNEFGIAVHKHTGRRVEGSGLSRDNLAA